MLFYVLDSPTPERQLRSQGLNAISEFQRIEKSSKQNFTPFSDWYVKVMKIWLLGWAEQREEGRRTSWPVTWENVIEILVILVVLMIVFKEMVVTRVI